MTFMGTGEEWKAMDESSTDAWRKDGHDQAVAEAKQSIERIRKTDIELTLARPDGSPLADTPVEIEQVRGDFEFGDQTWELDRMFRFGLGQTDRAFYWKKRFAEALTSANCLCYWTERPRNDGSKIEDVQGRNVTQYFQQCIDFALAHGLTPKGHPLFWSIDKCVPDWVKRYDYATQMKFAEVRVRNLVALGRGKVRIWDAVNEPMWEPAFKNLSQRHWPHIEPINDIADYIEPVLTWCRDEDPDATYLVNDYGMETDPPNGPPRDKDGRPVTAAMQRERFLALMRELQQRGTPPDGLGLQSHTGGWISGATQRAIYDQMGSTGIPVHITEFWANIKHLEAAGIPREQALQQQAEYVADTLTVAFGHPRVASFYFWGFMNSVQFFGDDSSHELTPMYHRVRQLVKCEWRTRLATRTDGNGTVRFRGFLGDYVVRHPVSGKARTGRHFSARAEDGPLARKCVLATCAERF